MGMHALMQVTANVEGGGPEGYLLKSTATSVKFPGYLAVYPPRTSAGQLTCQIMPQSLQDSLDTASAALKHVNDRRPSSVAHPIREHRVPCRKTPVRWSAYINNAWAPCRCTQ